MKYGFSYSVSSKCANTCRIESLVRDEHSQIEIANSLWRSESCHDTDKRESVKLFCAGKSLERKAARTAEALLRPKVEKSLRSFLIKQLANDLATPSGVAKG